MQAFQTELLIVKSGFITSELQSWYMSVPYSVYLYISHIILHKCCKKKKKKKQKTCKVCSVYFPPIDIFIQT